MPCPHGCGGHWTHPQAERDHVIDAEGEPDPAGEPEPVRKQGNAAQADRIGAEFIRQALVNWGFASGEQGRGSTPTAE